MHAWEDTVAAFGGMHVLPAKHCYAWLPRKCDYRIDRHTDGQTDTGQSDPYVSLCFAGTIKDLKFDFQFHDWNHWLLPRTNTRETYKEIKFASTVHFRIQKSLVFSPDDIISLLTSRATSAYGSSTLPGAPPLANRLKCSVLSTSKFIGPAGQVQ